MVGRKKKNQQIRRVSESSDEETLMQIFLRTKSKKEETHDESDSPNEDGVFEVEAILDKRIIRNTDRVGLIAFLSKYCIFQKCCYFRCRLNI